MIKEGMTIEFSSGKQYEITKVFTENLVDLKAKQPEFEFMPNYYHEYYSVTIKDYKIIEE